MCYIELCNKKIYHLVRLGARSDSKTWNLVSVFIDGNGNAIKIVRFSILLLAVPRRLFSFGFLVVLDVVCDYVLLFLLDIKIENR